MFDNDFVNKWLARFPAEVRMALICHILGFERHVYSSTAVHNN